ncbi:MAG: M48 family metallopeptidase [Hyphomicrobiaceae bacterium]|nr:M48 family metallopeptidase [Hyphomicrobiaceae bacterium]
MRASFVFGRAVLAVALLIGFYALALGIALGLFWVPYAELVYGHRITPKLAFVCIVGGGAILWSVLPRPDRFRAPGPQLKPETYPRLFEELGVVAQATGQAMPSEVYLVPDVNAWVTQRGGIMGFGSRRVMGLGLPLMRILTRSQFRAVLAHEFGHYYGGDTKIGPWIYKTRAAIGRTLHALADRSWLQAPFRWYGSMFLRITHAVSRRQEFVADGLAARTVGARPLIEGLCCVHKVAPAFHDYWRRECGPVFSAGFLPPLADGFGQFVKAAHIAEGMDKYLEDHLARGEADPYDTHPSLRERIAAVERLPQGSDLPEDPPAVSLLQDVPTLERQLMAQLAGPDEAAKLTPIVWGEVGSRVYFPHWARLVQLNAASLSGVTPESLSKVAADPKSFGKGLVDLSKQAPGDETAEALAIGVAGAALNLLLIERGGRLDVTPGHDISVKLGGYDVKPFGVLPALKDGTMPAHTWEAQCAELGIAGADLGAVAASALDGTGLKSAGA